MRHERGLADESHRNFDLALKARGLGYGPGSLLAGSAPNTHLSEDHPNFSHHRCLLSVDLHINLHLREPSSRHQPVYGPGSSISSIGLPSLQNGHRTDLRRRPLPRLQIRQISQPQPEIPRQPRMLPQNVQFTAPLRPHSSALLTLGARHV